MKFLKKVKKSIFFLNYKILRKIRIFFKVNQKCLINENELILPPEHYLTLYEKLYPKYDKFLQNFIINKKKINYN